MELVIIIGIALLVIYLLTRVQQIYEVMKKDVSQTVQLTSEHMRTNSQLVADVSSKLAAIEHSQRQVLSLTQQLQELDAIFKNPKRRGIVGEFILAEQLREVLPEAHFEMQYRMANGAIVDAVVHFKDLHIPIDSKFPLENFAKAGREREFIRDVKLRIDETSQYISPFDDTTPFVFMYVPAEGVMEHLLAEDIIQYAFQQKVILVSPISFFAYLQTVLHGLNALVIEQKTKEILVQLNTLNNQFQTWQENVGKVGKYLDQAQTAYLQSQKTTDKVTATINSMLESKTD